MGNSYNWNMNVVVEWREWSELKFHSHNLPVVVIESRMFSFTCTDGREGGGGGGVHLAAATVDSGDAGVNS